MIERCQPFTSQNIKKELRHKNPQLSELNLQYASDKLRNINGRHFNSQNTLKEKIMKIELMYEEPKESCVTTKSEIEEQIEQRNSHSDSRKPIDPIFLEAFE